MNHFYAFGGVCVSLARWRHLLIEAQLTGGGRFYGRHTSNGFKNDLLAPTGFAQLRVGIGYH